MIQLSENIRRMRKARGITQEQMAEVLGVTTGAVYKWEAKLSMPELSMLVRIADFFDVSMDSLIGYEMRDNRANAILQRLKDYSHHKDRRGIAEAEQAVLRYPNSFKILYQAATMMHHFSLEQGNDKKLAERAKNLYQKTLLLLEQNTDSEISELTIQIHIAECDLMLGRKKQALETLKANNPMGINYALIGMWAIIHCEDAEEAEEYLSRALLDHVNRLFTVTMGYVNLYEKQKRWNEARKIILWNRQMLEGLIPPNENNFWIKSCAVMDACLAIIEYSSGNEQAARKAFESAKNWAERFDREPCYDASHVCFVKIKENATAYDDMGTTGLDAVENMVREQADERLTELWLEVRNAEE